MNALAEQIDATIVEKQNRALSVVVHDLKSPLNAIHGFASFLLKNAKNGGMDGTHTEMLERIVSAGNDMAALINDITFMAKMEAGSEKMEPVPTDDLAGDLAEVLKTFEYEAQAKGIAVTLEGRGTLPPVFWDVFRIRNHVLNNLVSNALRVTPRGGTIGIELWSEDACVFIRVRDTGPGIKPEDAERIFDRFEQGASLSSRMHKGAGLGLHNASLFVRRHGGEIKLERSDVGASFLIRLPVSPSAH